MKFAYIAAALLPLAYANPFAWEAPEDNSLSFLDAREEDLTLVEARDEEGLGDLFAEIEARFTEFDDDEEEEELNEFEARSVGSVLGALRAVAGDIGGVDAKLKHIPKHGKPSQRAALAVEKAGAKLEAGVKSAISTVKKSGKVGKHGSKKVFGYVKGTLVPATDRSLGGFVARKAAFKAGGYTGLVRSRLSQLKGLTNDLGKALISKTKSGHYKKAGRKLNSELQRKFSRAIAAF